MLLRHSIVVLMLVPLASASARAQSGAQAHHHHADSTRASGDSAYAAMQARGKQVMGVDQYGSVHVFDALPDGGRIELQRPDGDSTDVEAIQNHLRDITRRFAEGDFSQPGSVHDLGVPGTRVLAQRRKHVHYAFRPLAKGGEVRITTHDPEALAALREFMAFQRREHHAAGRPR